MRSEESTIALFYAKFALLNSINSSSADVQIRAKEVMNKLCDILNMDTCVIEAGALHSKYEFNIVLIKILQNLWNFYLPLVGIMI